jgi:ribosomal protein S12 methylthiotransferase
MDEGGFHIISLGCAKNSVDSQSMAELLTRQGYRALPSRDAASVIIVNTCGFIGPAKEESLQVLRQAARAKKPGQLLIAAGCLTQRYGAEVAQEVPGIDGVLGTRRWMDIVTLVKKLRAGLHPEPVYHLPDVKTVGRDERGVTRAAVQGASAYLKIADGCRRPCAFCAIPLIKGTLVSRPLEDVLAEAERLAGRGVRELVLIAQDTTDYGRDLGMREGLTALLERLIETAPEIDWVRLMYAYPGHVTDALIDVMAEHPQILPYLDMPLQHAHPETLKRMRRPANVDWVNRTVEKLRARMPGLALRSTFIVGYPGETEAEFETLLDFIQEIRFDRLGVFTYFQEEATAADVLGDPISGEVKQARRERLMAAQQAISLQKNQDLVGRELDVLIEGYGDGLSVGRSYRDAPEIDGMVLVEGKAPVGEMVPVRVTGAMVYDLTGAIEDPRASAETGVRGRSAAP